MTTHNKTRDYFNREAKDFDASYQNARNIHDIIRRISYFYNKKAIERRVDALLSLIGDNIAGKNILEVGCGPGIYSIKLAQKGAIVTANDFASNMLHIAAANANKNGVSIRFIPGDFLDVQPPIKFEYVFATGVFDYIHPSQHSAFLQHMAALSNQFVIVSFPKRYVFHAVIRKLWLNLMKHIDVVYFTNTDIQWLASHCNLEEIERNDVGILWVIKFRKREAEKS